MQYNLCKKFPLLGPFAEFGFGFVFFFISSRISDLFMLKVANMPCLIQIKCSEQEVRFKKVCYNDVISEKNSNVCW
jgi:hypothetical protein